LLLLQPHCCHAPAGIAPSAQSAQC
jgi:hypothetical protein